MIKKDYDVEKSLKKFFEELEETEIVIKNHNQEFKNGDIVITSTGKIGIIREICHCKYCKERNFLEPIVDTIIGDEKIYISSNDKDLNFCNFYQIGDCYYGNIDKESLLYDIKSNEKELIRLKKIKKTLEAQMSILNNLNKISEVEE